MRLSNWTVHAITRALKWLFFTAGKKEGLRISCALIEKKRAYISQIFRLKLCLNGNRTLCRPIQSVIILVIKHDYRPNWTPLSPVTITYSGAPWVRKCGKLPMRENMVIT